MQAVKIQSQKIIRFLIFFSLAMGSLVVLGDITTSNSTNISEELSAPYITPWNSIQSGGTSFIMGYYINPTVTPISKINFTTLKNAGITDIYVLVRNDNYYPILSEAKLKADAVGIKTNAWVFPGFKHAHVIARMKIGVQLDVETYNMTEYIPEIKAMREATQGVSFSVCAKPEKWDGYQYYDLIYPHCDYIVPLLYIGDYDMGITHLKSVTRFYNYIYPRKIVAGLETYESDQNLTPKDGKSLLKEIRAVQHHTRGVILFRYGLSKFH